MGDEERRGLIDHIAANPQFGVLMEGTEGARKLRWAVGGRGKSGGIRVITYYAGPRVPDFVLAAFGKNEKANISKAERNELRTVLAAIVTEYLRKGPANDQGRRKHPPRR
jgi:hypothetical protein